MTGRVWGAPARRQIRKKIETAGVAKMLGVTGIGRLWFRPAEWIRPE